MSGYFKRLRNRQLNPGDEYISIFIIAITAAIVGGIIFSIGS
jgi:hypothetical protein